jgi:hypothetical protein
VRPVLIGPRRVKRVVQWNEYAKSTARSAPEVRRAEAEGRLGRADAAERPIVAVRPSSLMSSRTVPVRLRFDAVLIRGTEPRDLAASVNRNSRLRSERRDRCSGASLISYALAVERRCDRFNTDNQMSFESLTTTETRSKRLMLTPLDGDRYAEENGTGRRRNTCLSGRGQAVHHHLAAFEH